MNIGKLRLTIGRSKHPGQRIFKVVNVHYFFNTARELVIHFCGIYVNFAWGFKDYEMTSTEKYEYFY